MKAFKDLVLAFIKAIPKGKVATYGQIAGLAGAPRNARQVGEILHGVKDGDDIPWQRVINAQGGISTYKIGHGELQKALLEFEGVEVSGENKVDLSIYQWQPEGDDEQGRLF